MNLIQAIEKIFAGNLFSFSRTQRSIKQFLNLTLDFDLTENRHLMCGVANIVAMW